MSSHRLLQVPLPAEEAPEGDEGQAGKGGGEGNPLRTSDPMPSLEGKKMFLYLAPKKAGAQKKSQQARDREAAELEAKEAAKQQKEAAAAESSANGGLFANAKISADALKKLTEDQE